MPLVGGTRGAAMTSTEYDAVAQCEQSGDAHTALGASDADVDENVRAMCDAIDGEPRAATLSEMHSLDLSSGSGDDAAVHDGLSAIHKSHVRREALKERFNTMAVAVALSMLNLILVEFMQDVVRRFPQLVAVVPLVITVGGISALQSAQATEHGAANETHDIVMSCASWRAHFVHELKGAALIAPVMALLISVATLVVLWCSDLVRVSFSVRMVGPSEPVDETPSARLAFSVVLAAMTVAILLFSALVGASAPYVWRMLSLSSESSVGIMETTLLDLVGTAGILGTLKACMALGAF